MLEKTITMLKHTQSLLKKDIEIDLSIVCLSFNACYDELNETEKLINKLEAREKGVKPTYVENDLNDGSVYVCGSCGCPVSFKEFKATYCYKCGDKVLW